MSTIEFRVGEETDSGEYLLCGKGVLDAVRERGGKDVLVQVWKVLDDKFNIIQTRGEKFRITLV